VVGMWGFDSIEPGNKVLDISGYRNHGTVVGGAVLTKGVVGNALNFDNFGEYVSVPQGNLQITGDVTVSFFWFPTICPEAWYGMVIAMGDRPNNAYLFYIQGMGIPPYTCWLHWGFYDDGGSFREPKTKAGIMFSTPFSNIANKWNHILGVRKNGVLTLYLNGEKVAGPTDYSAYSVATSGFGLGISASFDGYYRLTGLIDEVRIYEQGF